MMTVFETNDFLSDAGWFELAQKTALGTILETPRHEIHAMERLFGLGFGRVSACRFVHEAPLEATCTLCPSPPDALASIDAIGIISVDRGGQTKPYLFDTLRSTFAAFPPTIQVNVILGDDSADYVASKRLEAELGAAWARRVHVHVPAREVCAFVSAHFGVHLKMAWNYSRALRSYSGTKHFLLLEDDIQWARNGPGWLDKQLVHHPQQVLSLYNRVCEQLPGESDKELFRPHLVRFPQRAIDPIFACSQAMIYHASVVQSLGAFVGIRLGRKPADHLVDEFMRLKDLSIAYAQPSMVQHVGHTTTGLGSFHESQCYTPTWGP